MNFWADKLANEKQKPYFQKLHTFVEQERAAGKQIYPAMEDIYSAFSLTELADIKVVILGQDPYHGPNQAHGLCFSVLPGVKPPPSLVNIYKELATDIAGFVIPEHGYLKPWAEQGVFMLNTVLTVEQGKAHSHAKMGWESFTDTVMALINDYCNGVIFVLWGAHAQRKGKFIDETKHYVLAGPHPSPLSAYRGFFGCGHFSTINDLLARQDKPAINWQV